MNSQAKALNYFSILASAIAAGLYYFDYLTGAAVFGALTFLGVLLTGFDYVYILIYIIIITLYKVFLLPEPVSITNHLFLLCIAAGIGYATFIFGTWLIIISMTIVAIITGRIRGE